MPHAVRPVLSLALALGMVTALPATAAPTLDGAPVTQAMTTAIDTCLSVIEGSAFDPRALQKQDFEINDTPTVPILTFFDGNLETASVNRNPAPRAIYEQNDDAPGCILYFVKPDMSFTDAYGYALQVLQQRGWARAGRSGKHTKGDVSLNLSRGQKRDLYLRFSLQRQ